MTAWPCIHRGPELRRVQCVSRGQETEAAVHACAEPSIGGECTLAATSLGLPDCFGCAMRLNPDAPPKPAVPPVLPEAFPCVHRGPLLREDKCDLCGVRGMPLDVYQCAVHGECSIARRHSKIKSCTGCEQRQEQPPPVVTLKPPRNPKLVTDRKGNPAYGWENRFRGAHAFLICGGPSLTSHDLSQINRVGILTAAVNNAAAVHRPHLWFMLDCPGSFSPVLLRDPGIHKFMPRHRADQPLRERRGKQWVETNVHAQEMPNVWWFRNKKGFNPQSYLIDKHLTYSASGPGDGEKNLRNCIMFVALRLLFWMGVRTLYLLGADFKMQKERPYAFKERLPEKLVGFNNRKYAIVNQAFTEARQHFADYGYRVLNCCPDSGLTAFPFIEFGEAVRRATEAAGATEKPVTRGLYGR